MKASIKFQAQVYIKIKVSERGENSYLEFPLLRSF